MSTLNPNQVTRAIDIAWENGHILKAFSSDTDESVVTECIRCGDVIAVDGNEIVGQATKRVCLSE